MGKTTQAKAAGLSTSGTPLDLLRRLNYLSNYVKLKTAGKTSGSFVMDNDEEVGDDRGGNGISTTAPPGHSLVAGSYTSDSDDDLDGKPLDTVTTPRNILLPPGESR